MGKEDALLRRAGDNMVESIGVRGNTVAAVRGLPKPATAARYAGLSRSRTAGEVDIDRIIPDPTQPRTDFDEESIDRLAESIQARGQLQPIRTRWAEPLGMWVIVSGERRFRAARRAGLRTVKCEFIEGELTEDEVLEDQLTENLQREDLRPLDQARAFHELMTRRGWSGRELARRLHLNQSTVARALALLDLPPEVREKVDAGRIGPSVAYEIAKAETPERQRRLAKEVVAGDLTRDATAAAVRRKKAGAGPRDGRPGNGPRAEAARGTSPASGPTTLSYTVPAGATISITFPRRSVSTDDVRAAVRQLLDQLDGQSRREAAASEARPAS
jgi:ParB family chromosome partitioning protein